MSFSKILLGTVAAGSLLVPAFAAAQYYNNSSTAALVVTTQVASGVALPTSSGVVTVVASGPSLSGVPTSQGSLTYASDFINDTKIVTMVPGNFAVAMAGPSGYNFTYSQGCSGVLSQGQTGNCTITANTYNNGSASLTVYTNVTTQYNGQPYGGYGSYSPQNFTITVNGNSPFPSNFIGSSAGTLVTLGSGSYSVNPQQLGGWTVTQSGSCSGTINSGETRSCTVNYANNQYNPYPPYNNQYPYYNSLSCAALYPTVNLGQNATFYAQGGVGTYSWTTPNRTYTSVGPVLSATLTTTGTQIVTVTSGSQTATCSVNVVASGAIYPTYPSYPPYTYPTLPNTGFEPQSGFAVALALVLLLAASLVVFPYVRKNFASLLG